MCSSSIPKPAPAPAPAAPSASAYVSPEADPNSPAGKAVQRKDLRINPNRVPGTGSGLVIPRAGEGGVRG